MFEIKPPFDDYERSELEILVYQEFENLRWLLTDDPPTPVLSLYELQVLVAADYYLRTTK